MSTSATSGGRSTRRASGACSTPSGAPGTCSRGPSESARSAALDPHPCDALVHRYSLGDPRRDRRALVLAPPLPPDPGSRHLPPGGRAGGQRHRLGGIGRHLETLLVLIPLGLTLAAAGGAVIARSVLRPVDTMSRTARRISGEDLHERLPRRETGDELDHLAETLNAMLARLEATFAQMRRFTADAAHELRTPLTALKGTIEVALRTERSGEEYRRVLASSLEDVERLVRLAEDLLLLSRLSVPASASRERVELEPLLDEIADIAGRVADERGVVVGVKERAPAAVMGDAIALRRAVMKLVENAVKYTPRGGRAELALRVADGWAEIAVSDTGVGMDPADLERIFEPFVRLDAARTRDTAGAGLGLPIARSIVTAHGGTLGAESTPGAGSTFTIRLPLA